MPENEIRGFMDDLRPDHHFVEQVDFPVITGLNLNDNQKQIVFLEIPDQV
jgi:hypothetical protein